MTEKELQQGWRLGYEKRRDLVYKTKLWGSKGAAFRRRHDEHTQMYTYEALLESKQSYTYNIHALMKYQQVLRSQLNAKQNLMLVRERRRRKKLAALKAAAAAALAASKAEAEADVKRLQELQEMADAAAAAAAKEQELLVLSRQLLPHEQEMELPMWVKLFDSEHTSYYYYHQQTGEALWDRPAEYMSPRHAYSVRWLLSERPRAALVIQQLFRQCLAKMVYKKHYDRVREEDVGLIEDATGTKWRVRLDEESGETYYQHDKHGAKQWKKPGDWRTHGEKNEQMDKVHQMIANLGK